MPTVTTRDNVRLHVKSWGDPGGRPVILLHGWPLSADTWDPQAQMLAEAGYRAISYDRRGFGRSEQPWDGYDYDSLTDDLRDVMRAMEATRDVTLVGFSMGGGEVVRYMSRHRGEGVTSAALISSVVPLLIQGPDNPDGVPAATLDEMTAGMRDDRPAFMRQFLGQFFGQGVLLSSVSDAVMDWAFALTMQAGLRPTLACAEAFATTDFRTDLPHLTVPTLVIHGTADAVVPIDATGRTVARALPDVTFLEYDGSPHGLFVTEQDRLGADLVNFLASPSAARVESEPFGDRLSMGSAAPIRG